MRREYVAAATLTDSSLHSPLNRTTQSVLAVCAMAITTAVCPGFMKAQEAAPARVTGNEIRVVDLPVNASSDELQQAKEAFKQGHIIRIVGGSPADLQRSIGVKAYDVNDKNARQSKIGPRTMERAPLPQVTAVRLGKDGDLHQFTSEIDSNAKEPPKLEWEKEFHKWQLKESNAALGDTPGPPAQAWTYVLNLTRVLSGDWGSAQYVMQVFRLNGTDTSADYYMVLTDPQIAPNFKVPGSNCASAFLTDCGYYTSSRLITMSTDPAAVLFEHGPNTPITTSSGYWSIGGGLPAGVNAGWAQNWSQDSVTTADQSNLPAGIAQWQESFVSESCCTQLPATSTSPFLSHQGAVFKVPPGASFRLTVNIGPTLVYQPAFGNPWGGAAGFYFNEVIAPPQLSLNPSSITIAPGTSGNIQVISRIGDDTIGLPWAISNIPGWLNVDQITGARTTVLKLTVAAGTPLGTLGTLNINTDPPYAAPSVVSGPLKMDIKVGQPDVAGVILIGGAQQSPVTSPDQTALFYSADTNQFTGISEMVQPRAYHTSTTLQDGTILVAGGISGGSQNTALATAELYDPTSNKFSSISGGAHCPGASGCMLTAASSRTATRLANGRVLITGGLSVDQSCMSAAEVYDPTTRTFAAVGSMASGRCFHTAALLPTGEVLVSGGISSASLSGSVVPTAELYSPASNSFRSTGSPSPAVSSGNATTVGDMVLLTGGTLASEAINPAAQLYNPTTGTFAPIGNVNVPRYNHSTTVLQDGRVLLAGGNISGGQTATAEIYDPATRNFSLVSGSGQCPGASGCMSASRALHTDTLLINGRVLLSGGVDSAYISIKTTDIFDPATNTFSAGPTFDGRASHTSAYLRAPSAIAVQSSANPSPAGQPVTFTATMTVSNVTALSGSVTFYDGATVLGSSPLSNGIATLTAKLTNGSHAITAQYPGNSWYGQSTSSVVVQQVNATPTSMTLSSDVNPSQYGAGVTLTAQLTASGTPAPTGTVKFLDGGTVIGSVPVTGLTTVFKVSTLSAGAHTISATYSGDVNYAADDSNSITQTVNGIASQTALSSSVNPVTLGAPVTFTATVSFTQGQGPGSTPTGRVVFADAGAPINSAVLVNGKATYTTSTLTQGLHKITAAYSGDGIYAASTSTVLNQTAGSMDATVTLSSSVNPAQVGAAIDFTATVKSGSEIPTGGVTFRDGTSTIGLGTLKNGVAVLSVSTLSAGTHEITVVYRGDSNYAAATSNVIQQQVNAAPVSITLTADINPSAVNQPVNFSAAVTSPNGKPAGTVTFQDGATTLGNAALNSGVAVYTTSALTAGTHNITAVYAGSGGMQGATSHVLVHFVKWPTVTTIVSSSPNPSQTGQAVTFTVRVTSPGGTPPDGSITISENNQIYASAPLSNGMALVSVPANVLAAGVHNLNATYGGDDKQTYTGSTSAWYTQTVNNPSTR